MTYLLCVRCHERDKFKTVFADLIYKGESLCLEHYKGHENFKGLPEE